MKKVSHASWWYLSCW